MRTHKSCKASVQPGADPCQRQVEVLHPCPSLTPHHQKAAGSSPCAASGPRQNSSVCPRSVVLKPKMASAQAVSLSIILCVHSASLSNSASICMCCAHAPMHSPSPLLVSRSVCVSVSLCPQRTFCLSKSGCVSQLFSASLPRVPHLIASCLCRSP